MTLEEYNDQTTIECWHIASSNSEKNFIEQEFNLPFDRNGSQHVRTGTIFEKPSDIKFNEKIHFFVFRVVVGRAMVLTKKELAEKEDSESDLKNILKGTIYNSIYIAENPDDMNRKNDYISHGYRIFDKERCRLIYQVSCKIIMSPID